MKTRFAIITIVTTLLFCAHGEDATFFARVVAVHDGDTITVEADKRKRDTLRLAVIDAPELLQPHGTASAKSLTRELLGTTVKVKIESRDKYGRAVAFVWRGQIAVNLERVKNGDAWFYDLYSQVLQFDERKTFLEAETRARKTKNGLWSLPAPVAPWVWRHSRKVQ